MPYNGTRWGGYYMEYPTVKEAEYYIRELPYEQRFSVLTQGFHFGASEVHCYNFQDLLSAIRKREYNNPAGGVRELEESSIVPWLRNVIGDHELAAAIQAIYERTESMPEIMDTIRVVLYVRSVQYKEVISEYKEGK